MFKSTLLFLFLIFSQDILSFTIEKDTLYTKNVVLDEVVVTSYKEKANIRKIPASISRISLSEMQNKNIQGVKDFSASIPNLFIPDYGSKLTSPVYIRGIGSKINAPSVGLYVDGIPYFEKSVFDFEMNEVDRVEVLRGPQGTLYGRNTMGGIINVYTKNPLTYQGTSFSAIAANFGQAQLSGSYYGAANQSLGYSVSGNFKHGDGFFRNQFTGGMVDDYNSGSGKIKLYWKATSRLNISFHAGYDYSDQGGYPYGLVDPLTGKIGPVNYNDYSSYRREIFSSGLNLDYVFDHFTLKSVTGFQYFDDKQAIDQDFTPRSVNFVTQAQRQQMFFQELTLRSFENKRYTWLNGFFAFHQGLVNTVNVEMSSTNGFTKKDYDSPSDGFAFYHQSSYRLFANLSATVGLRFDYEKSSQDYVAGGLTAGKPVVSQTLNTDIHSAQLTPKFSLQCQLSPTKMLYTAATKGYKTGGFNTSFNTVEEQTFDPEYSWNYEVGGKFSFFNNRLITDFALFYIDWNNQQVSQPLVTKMGSMLRNAGKSTSKGLELSMIGRVCKGLNLQMNYGYTEAKYRLYESSKFNYSGNYIPFVPRQTVMLGADYTLKLNSNLVNSLVFSTQYIGTGKLYWSDDNVTSQGYYGVVNGKMSAYKGNFRVDFWIKNATSTDYTAFNFKIKDDFFAQKGKPMTFGTTFAYTIK